MFEQLQEVILREMERGWLPGLAIALVKDQEIVWSKGYGYADLDRGLPVTPSTVFSAQSVTKPVVATALMQWWERGRFGLDDPVNDHLAPVRVQNEWEDTAPVTVRQLLTHSSGLPVDIGAPTPPPTGVLPLGEYVAAVARTVRPPGEEIVYANWGYATLGYLIERFASQPYDVYLRGNVLEPLGMPSSAIGGAPEGTAAATGYFLSALDGRRHETAPLPWRSRPPEPAGALYSTVEDLARFLIAHLNGGAWHGSRILREETVAEMHRVHAPSGPSHRGMGLGFMVDVAGGRRLICHGGDGPGWTAFIGAYPEEKVGAALLINMGRAEAARSAIGNSALRLLAGVYQHHEAGALGRAPVSEEWERVTGRYVSNFWDMTADVVIEDGTLLVRGGGVPPTEDDRPESYLEQIDAGRFLAHGGLLAGFELTFEYAVDGQAAAFFGGLYPVRFQRKGDTPPPSQVLVDEEADLAGRWCGTISTPIGPVPVTLVVTDDSEAAVTALSAQNAPVEQFGAARGRVSGEFDVTVPGLGELRIFLRLGASGGCLAGRVYARGSIGEVPLDAELRRETGE